MRFAVIVASIIAVGCVGSNPSRNPLRGVSDSPTTVASSSVAAVATEATPVLSRVEQMKALFEQRHESQNKFMELAEGLSASEFKELNLWLEHYGVQLNRQCQDPNHNHDEDSPKDKGGSDDKVEGEVY